MNSKLFSQDQTMWADIHFLLKDSWETSEMILRHNFVRISSRNTQIGNKNYKWDLFNVLVVSHKFLARLVSPETKRVTSTVFSSCQNTKVYNEKAKSYYYLKHFSSAFPISRDLSCSTSILFLLLEDNKWLICLGFNFCLKEVSMTWLRQSWYWIQRWNKTL